MTRALRTACAAIALLVAAQAEATDLWINSDSTSRENKLGSVVLLELGTTASCIICRPVPAPIGVQMDGAAREREPDFYASVARRRAGNERDYRIARPVEHADPLGVESGTSKGTTHENSPHDANTPHLR